MLEAMRELPEEQEKRMADDPRLETLEQAAKLFDDFDKQFNENNPDLYDQPLSNDDYNELKYNLNSMAREMKGYLISLSGDELNESNRAMLKGMNQELQSRANTLRGYDPQNPKSLRELEKNPVKRQISEKQEEVGTTEFKEIPAENGNLAGSFLAEMDAATGIKGTSTQFEAIRDKLTDYFDFADQFKGKPIGTADQQMHDQMLRDIQDMSKAYMKRAANQSGRDTFEQRQLNVVEKINQFATESKLNNGPVELENEIDKTKQSAMNFAMYDDLNKDKQSAMDAQKKLNDALQRDLRQMEKAMKDPNNMVNADKIVADYLAHSMIKRTYENGDGEIDPKDAEKIDDLMDSNELQSQLMSSPDFAKLMDTLEKNPLAKEKFLQEAKGNNKEKPNKEFAVKKKEKDEIVSGPKSPSLDGPNPMAN